MAWRSVLTWDPPTCTSVPRERSGKPVGGPGSISFLAGIQVSIETEVPRCQESTRNYSFLPEEVLEVLRTATGSLPILLAWERHSLRAALEI